MDAITLTDEQVMTTFSREQRAWIVDRLKVYGRHTTACAWRHPPARCDCGLVQTLRLLIGLAEAAR